MNRKWATQGQLSKRIDGRGKEMKMKERSYFFVSGNLVKPNLPDVYLRSQTRQSLPNLRISSEYDATTKSRRSWFHAQRGNRLNPETNTTGTQLCCSQNDAHDPDRTFAGQLPSTRKTLKAPTHCLYKLNSNYTHDER